MSTTISMHSVDQTNVRNAQLYDDFATGEISLGDTRVVLLAIGSNPIQAAHRLAVLGDRLAANARRAAHQHRTAKRKAAMTKALATLPMRTFVAGQQVAA